MFFRPTYSAELNILFKSDLEETARIEGTKNSVDLFQLDGLIEQYAKRIQKDFLIQQSLKDHDTKDVNRTSVAKNMSQAMDVSQISDGLHIVFRGDTPEGAKYFAEVLGKAYADAFNSLYQEDSLALNIKLENLNQAINDTRVKLIYNVINNLDAAGARELIARYSEAVAARIYFDIIVETLEKYKREKIPPLGISEIATLPVIRSKLDKLDDVEVKIAKIKMELGENSRQLSALQAEYTVIQDQLEYEISQTIQNINNDRIIATETENRLKNIFMIKVSSDETREKVEENQKKLVDLITNKIKVEAEIDKHKFHILVSDVTVKDVIYGLVRNWPIILLIFLFSLMIFSALTAFTRRKIQMKQDNPPVQNEPYIDDLRIISQSQSLSNAEKNIKINELLKVIHKNKKTIIAFFGATAEEQGAQVALNAHQLGKTTLLIDVAGSEIARKIGIHTGLSDVLVGESTLRDAVYEDPETGVDILTNGRISSLRAASFSRRFPAVLKNLSDAYSVIILTISVEPFITLPDLLKNNIMAVIVEGKDDELWEETLLEVGFYNFRILKK